MSDLTIPNTTPLAATDLRWDEGDQPFSTTFEDHYFSAGNGREETRFVFLENNDLPNRWLNKEKCVIGELGFGTGLSFLETWALWRQNRRPGQHLMFQSVEAFPMTREALQRATDSWEDLAELQAPLLAVWGRLADGPVEMDEQTTLHVALCPVEEAIPTFGHKVDTWYLDGFAPARNPDMWSATVMAHLAEASAPQARFSSYTAAGWVRKNLSDAGFVVERRPGFGRKRHMIVGHLEPSS